MTQININIRMDADLKKEFNEFCKNVGMSMTTAFTIFAKKTVKEHKIPFEINDDTPNLETLEALAEARNIAKNPSHYKSYTDAHAMFKEILNDEE